MFGVFVPSDCNVCCCVSALTELPSAAAVLPSLPKTGVWLSVNANLLLLTGLPVVASFSVVWNAANFALRVNPVGAVRVSRTVKYPDSLPSVAKPLPFLLSTSFASVSPAETAPNPKSGTCLSNNRPDTTSTFTFDSAVAVVVLSVFPFQSAIAT